MGSHTERIKEILDNGSVRYLVSRTVLKTVVFMGSTPITATNLTGAWRNW